MSKGRHTLATTAPTPARRFSRYRNSGARGLTLVETSAALLLVAIVVPAAMRAVSAATLASGVARQQGEAAALAQSKLAQLVVTGEWELGSQVGDFGAEWSSYDWELTVGDWSIEGVRQLHLAVNWNTRGQSRTVGLTTLVYPPPLQSEPNDAPAGPPAPGGGT